MADTVVVDRGPNNGGDSGAGWIVAVIVLLAVIAGGIYVYRHGTGGAATPGPSTNINVTLPSSGGTSGQ